MQTNYFSLFKLSKALYSNSSIPSQPIHDSFPLLISLHL